MSFITSVLILVLAMLIQAFLQLNPSVFAIFYHNALGKKSPKVADNLSLYFFFGIEVFCAIVFLSIYFLLSTIFTYFPYFMTNIFPWIMSGIFMALAIVSFFWYFRTGHNCKKTTKLFISRSLAHHLTTCAEKVTTRSDAFLLGAFIGIIELGFTLPLYIICTFQIIYFTELSSFLIIILYIFSALLPLFIIHAIFLSHHNLANIQRFRIRKKPLFRITISLSFLIIAILTLISGII
ncbi:hypothetical protein IJG04_01120 [Candidatus Saccharibacteria bacterium]|nr:hypothetical protein [Candidatus Saccharibacteria bacterium]